MTERALLLPSIYNMQAILPFLGMLKTTRYYYKDASRPQPPDGARRIVEFLFAFTDAD